MSQSLITVRTKLTKLYNLILWQKNKNKNSKTFYYYSNTREGLCWKVKYSNNWNSFFILILSFVWKLHILPNYFHIYIHNHQPAITDYEVYLEAASYHFSAVVSAKSSPATFEGLQAGSKYYSHIVAFSDGGESRLSTSNTTTFYTLTAPPSNLTIVHINEISMKLKWLPVFGWFCC